MWTGNTRTSNNARYYHRRTQITSVGTRCQKSLNLKESYGNGGDSFLAHPFPTSFTFRCVFNDAAPVHPQPPLPPTPNPLPLQLWALRCASRPPLDELPYLMYLTCHAIPRFSSSLLLPVAPFIWGLFEEQALFISFSMQIKWHLIY